MTHSLSIRELASDIAKLSKTLTILAAEVESVLTQQTVAVVATEAVQKVEAKQEPVPKEKSSEASLKEDKPVVTIEQVRAVMAEKSQAGFTSKVKEVLEKFGAAKLSAVKPEDYEALLAAASAIK